MTHTVRYYTDGEVHGWACLTTWCPASGRTGFRTAEQAEADAVAHLTR